MFAVAAFTTIGLWFATRELLPRDVTCIDFCGIGWYAGIQISLFAGTIALMRAAFMGALPPARTAKQTAKRKRRNEQPRL